MHRTTAAEQRSKQRDLSSFSIELYGEDGKIADCKALNLSISGMLLDYDGAGLAIGSNVDVFACFQGCKSAMPAVVIHCNSSCIGIMFKKSQPDLYRAVTESMHCARLPINGRTPLSIVA